eukprot:UN13169
MWDIDFSTCYETFNMTSCFHKRRSGVCMRLYYSVIIYSRTIA